MFGCDYEIIYKKGKENMMVDTFSDKYEDKGYLFSLALPLPIGYRILTRMVEKWHYGSKDPNSHKGYSW